MRGAPDASASRTAPNDRSPIDPAVLHRLGKPGLVCVLAAISLTVAVVLTSAPPSASHWRERSEPAQER
jgi:hypothetical protein